MTFILIVWLWGSMSNAPPVVVAEYDTITACESAGKVWDKLQDALGRDEIHHACLPHQ